MKQHIPNLLTSLRAASALLPIAVMDASPASAAGVGLFMLVIAAATDYLDGRLSRAWAVTSRFGQVLDSVADKLVFASVLALALTHGMLGPVGSSIALLLLLREIWIGGLREGLGKASALLAATRAAKWKTTAQFAGMIVLFVDVWTGSKLGWIAELALVPALLLSIVSAWDYSRRGLSALLEEE
jgi:cardiolipin synthase (CMP-forming)